MKATGHSARRSGALHYIREGWDIPQVGYLGRWKSAIRQGGFGIDTG